MPDSSPAHRTNNFDFLRLFAALMVIYGHGWNLSTDGGPGFWGVPFARVGLDIFFSISGYMVTGSWLRAPRLGLFMRKRALRILPGLAACVTFWFLAGARLTQLPLADYLTNHNALKYLSNIILHPVLYLPGVFQGLREHGAVNGSLWSLFPEALCYLTVPVFALLALRARMSALALGGVAAGTLGLWLFYGYDGPAWVINAADVKYMLVQVPFFFAGGLLRLLEDRLPGLYRADAAILGYTLNWMVSSWYGWWNHPRRVGDAALHGHLLRPRVPAGDPPGRAVRGPVIRDVPVRLPGAAGDPGRAAGLRLPNHCLHGADGAVRAVVVAPGRVAGAAVEADGAERGGAQCGSGRLMNPYAGTTRLVRLELIEVVQPEPTGATVRQPPFALNLSAAAAHPRLRWPSGQGKGPLA